MSRVVPHAQSQPQPDGTVLTPRPMHNVVFDNQCLSGCGDAFFHDSRGSEPFTSKLHKIAIAQSLGPRSHGNPSLARPPVSLQKTPHCPRPPARPPSWKPRQALNFDPLNPFIGALLPIVGRWPSNRGYQTGDSGVLTSCTMARRTDVGVPLFISCRLQDGASAPGAL